MVAELPGAATEGSMGDDVDDNTLPGSAVDNAAQAPTGQKGVATYKQWSLESKLYALDVLKLSAAAALRSTSSVAEPDGDDGPGNAVADIPMAKVVVRVTAASAEFKQALEVADEQAAAELAREPVAAARRCGKPGGKRGKTPGSHTVGDGIQCTRAVQSCSRGRACGRGQGRPKRPSLTSHQWAVPA
jgi:hypothetical protein